MTVVLLHDVPLVVLDPVHHQTLEPAVRRPDALPGGDVLEDREGRAGLRGTALHTGLLVAQQGLLLVQHHVLAGLEGTGGDAGLVAAAQGTLHGCNVGLG